MCLLCKLFFRRNLNTEFIGLVFEKHRTRIGQVLRDWAPRWGKAGEQLSILDITLDFLDSEEPDRSRIVGVMRAVLVDGTDTSVERDRKDPTGDAILYEPKNKTQGARSLQWCTAGGMTFEHTIEFGACASEKACYRVQGSLGKKKAPLEEWKNVAITLSDDDKILRQELATHGMFDYHDMEEMIESLSCFDEQLESSVDEGVLLTATPEEVDTMPGVKRKQSTRPKEAEGEKK